MAKKVKVTISKQPSLVAGSLRQVETQWGLGKTNAKHTKGFDVDWEYKAGGKWHPGTVNSPSLAGARIGGGTTFRDSYTPPANAVSVRCRVRPVANTHTVTKGTGKKKTKKTVAWYSGAWSGYTSEFKLAATPLPAPSVSVSLGSDKVTATVTATCSDSDCSSITIQASRDKKAAFRNDTVYPAKGGRATYAVARGETWYFRARANTGMESKSASAWSAWAEAAAKPGAPGFAGIPAPCAATGDGSISFRWGAVKGAKSYTVQRRADNANFDSDPESNSVVSGITGTTHNAQNLAPGHKYYFRVQAVNDTGEGPWSAAKGAVLATAPDAPTTYETDAAYMTGDAARFRWTHNSTDESTQTSAQVMLSASGGPAVTVDVAGDAAYYETAFSSYADGSIVTWKVRTKGAHADWSPWSEARRFAVYQTPSLTVSANASDDEPLEQFPLVLSLDAAGGGNAVAAYHVALALSEPFEYVDVYGNEARVPAGETVFEKDYLTDEDPFEVSLGVDDFALWPNGSFSVAAEVVMQSGLMATAPAVGFSTNFDVDVPEPEADVTFLDDSLTALVVPACYAEDDGGRELVEGVRLSVFRIEQDGSLVKLMGNIPNDLSVTVIDQHATFGDCEYRVVATDALTGAMSFGDAMADSTFGTCVIQWAEKWNLELTEDDLYDYEEGGYAFAGKMLTGLTNLQLEESGEVESEDVEYVGREHPVSYYGTQKGYKARYSVQFPKSDAEKMRLSRELLGLRDDAYIREPSGTGFWAHVKCSLSRNYGDLLVTLTVEATRVDREDESITVALGGE